MGDYSAGESEPGEDPSEGEKSTKDRGPVIFSLGLGLWWEQELFASSHKSLMTTLKNTSDLRLAETMKEALDLFKECPRPKAILVSDPGMLEEQNNYLALRVIKYAKDGGTVVFGGLLPSYVDPYTLSCHFQHYWGLSWCVQEAAGPDPWPPEKRAAQKYDVSEHGLSLARNCPLLDEKFKAAIPPRFHSSHSASTLSDVARRDAWYIYEGPEPEGLTAAPILSQASAVLEAAFAAEGFYSLEGPDPPQPLADLDTLDEPLLRRRAAADALTPTRSPIAYADVGLGHVGYVGGYQRDCPDARDIITLAMLKL